MIPRFSLEMRRKEPLGYLRMTIPIPGDPKRYRPYLPKHIRISQDHWDKKKQRLKPLAPRARHINNYLDQVGKKITDVWYDLLDQGTLQRYDLARQVEIIINKRDVEIFGMFDEVIKEKRVDPHYQTDSKKNSLARKYKNVRDKIYAYDSSLTFSAINEDFLRRWVSFLYTDYELSPNTVHRYVKFLKTFMKETQKRGYHKNEAYEDFHVKPVPVIHPYLNHQEIELLGATHVMKDELMQTQTWLLIACYSALRHSDWKKLKSHRMSEVDGIECYTISNKKTRAVVHIPAHHKLRQQVQKDIPPPTNQDFNKNVKILGKIAGLYTSFTRPVYIGNKMTEVTTPKYEVLSSHIGRRSFASNGVLDGIPREVLKRVGGWKTEESFAKYIKLLSVDGYAQLFSKYAA